MPEVFISYSDDSEEHKKRVLALADHLREHDGFDCLIDRYVEPVPSEGWVRWMANSVSDSKFVLVVCTEAYKERFDRKAPKGVGKGGKWEGGVINQELHDDETHEKYIPILLDPNDRDHIPKVLRAATHYLLTDQASYDRLCMHLSGQKPVEPPDTGKKRDFPPEERAPFF